MAPRHIWRGYRKLSLVACAVELTNAVSEHDKVRFRTLNRRTGNPVKRAWVDSETGRTVDEDDVTGLGRRRRFFLSSSRSRRRGNNGTRSECDEREELRHDGISFG